MNFSSNKMILMVCYIASIILILACSNSEVAGGVTDIDNSLTGVVVDQNDHAMAQTRIVGYYDSWEESGIIDSVEAVYSDSNGNFSMDIDSSRSIVLYAESDDECVLAKVTQMRGNKLVLGRHKSLESSINGANSGYVRIVGTKEIAPVGQDGSFRFETIPPGDITIAYIYEDEPSGYLDFRTTDDRREINLPPMEPNPDEKRFHHPEGEEDSFGVDFGMDWGKPHDKPMDEGDGAKEDFNPNGNPPDSMDQAY